MAVQHFFAGPATVQVKYRDQTTGNLDAAYTTVGINREAIPIIITPRFLDVPTDAWAGTDGYPADTQFMGAIANIQLSLTKYEIAQVDKLIEGVANSAKAVSVFPEFGSFARQNNLMFALYLESAYATRLFNWCFVRNGGSVGQGTRYTSYDLQVEAWIDDPSTRDLFAHTYP